ncbi:MAG: SufD family Fe-S cluster assembly protein [Nitrososphaera sp.]|jgi:Fe-S cluster assembly scaffold protein SufB
MSKSISSSLSDISESYISSVSKNSGEPSWMLDQRLEAFSKFASLPLEVSPLYSKYSDANRIKPQGVRFSFSEGRPALSEYMQDRLEELEKETGIISVGSHTVSVSISDKLRSSGVIVSSLQEALVKNGDLVRRFLERDPLSYSEDKFLALGSAAFQTGAFVYIPRDAVVEDPIRIISTLAGDGTSTCARNVIVAEPGSKASVVQEVYAPEVKSDSMQQGNFELIQAHVGANANLEMISLQAMGGDSVNACNKKAFVGRDGKMSWYVGAFGSMLSRYKTDSILKEAGASAEDVEIVFGTGTQSFDVSSNLIHVGPHTRGRVLVKSVMKDVSKSLFKGMIKIGKAGKGSESYLAGHAILLDRGAKSDAIPGLEIETNEVRATHSASVAQMDENQIYYLCTRGLSREGAKREIVSGFLEPLSRKMGPTIRAWVNYLIENKWLGKPLLLKTDDVMAQILEVERSRYHETSDIFEKHYKYR